MTYPTKLYTFPAVGLRRMRHYKSRNSWLILEPTAADEPEILDDEDVCETEYGVLGCACGQYAFIWPSAEPS